MLRENRHGLLVTVRLTQAVGGPEREAAVEMGREIAGAGERVTPVAEKGYETREWVQQMRPLAGTPHVAHQAAGHRSAIDGWTRRHKGYRLSQRMKQPVEEFFG